MMLALALAATTAVAGAGGEPQAKASADVDSVALGDSFHVTVEVQHRTDLAVNLPPSVPLGDAFTVDGRSVTATDNGDGTTTTRFDLTVVAFDVGELEIPAIEVIYVSEGTSREVSTEPIPIRVEGVIDQDSPELQPLAGPVQVTRPDWTLLYILGGLGVAIALIAIVWAVRWSRRRRGKVSGRALEAELVPADKEALARLVELEASGALEAEKLEPAYTSLSEIVRAYLGRRYDFPALDLTTEEINRYLAATPQAAIVAEELAELLAACDFVKFAEYPSTPDEARAALYAARKLVQRSAPAQPAVAPAAEPPDQDQDQDQEPKPKPEQEAVGA